MKKILIIGSGAGGATVAKMLSPHHDVTVLEAGGTFRPLSLPDNLYVADASLLPQSLGLPPMLTIMALAKQISRRIQDA